MRFVCVCEGNVTHRYVRCCEICSECCKFIIWLMTL